MIQKENNRKVSVCLTTHNGALFLKEQLDSIFYQIDKNDEVIISDDGSSDKTMIILKSYSDPRIKIYQNNFGSVLKNFEFALSKAKGDYVFLCDQDDIWLPNKVSSMLFTLQKYDLVVSDAEVVDQNLNVIHKSFFLLRNSGSGFWKNIIHNTYLGCCMAFNRKILKASLPFPENIPMHDIWIGLIGEVFGRTLFLNTILLQYRRHNNNASPTSERSNYSFYRKVLFRVNLFIPLVKRIIKKRVYNK